MIGNFVEMVQSPTIKDRRSRWVLLVKYNANKKKITNTVSSELEGSRRPKQTQMKGNIVMVQELKYICIDGVGGLYQSYYNANKKKLTDAVSSELEGFRRHTQAQMKGNIVKMVQELKYICIDGVGGLYQYEQTKIRGFYVLM